ncbi:MAG: response regulator transcription factor [Flavobacteriales bacterium]
MNKKPLILIADPQAISRIGLIKILSEKYKLYQAANGAQTLQAIRKIQPDLLIADFTNGEAFSDDDILIIKAVLQQCKILMISDESNTRKILEHIESGVNGYLTKECEPEEVTRAISAILNDKKFFCNKVMNLVLQRKLEEPDCEPTKLTFREHEIIILIAKGLTNKKVAEKLGLSYHTVHAHRKNIMKKLAAKSTSDLVLYAVNTGLI